MNSEETTEYYSIAYRDHDIMNPLTDERLMLLARQCGLSDRSCVVDIGGGNGYAALLLSKEWGCTIKYIDNSEQWAAEAQRRFSEAGLHSLLEVYCADAAEISLNEFGADLILCLGTTPIYGSFGDALSILRNALDPGGHIIVGELSLDGSVNKAFRDYLLKMRWQILSSPELLKAIKEENCELLWALRSTHDEWDRYMGLQWNAVTRYVAEHPSDGKAQTFLDWMRREQYIYLRSQRHLLEWNVMLIQAL